MKGIVQKRTKGVPMISVELATEIVQKLCLAGNVTWVAPESKFRSLVVHLFAWVYSVLKKGWDLATVDQSVTFTLPGIGSSLDLFKLLDYVSAGVGTWFCTILTALLKDETRTSILPSKAALATGGTILTTWVHEWKHVLTIAAQGIPWCVWMLLDKETMAGSEGPAYGQTLTGLVYLCGYTAEEARDECYADLAGYGLGEDATVLAKGLIDIAYRTAKAGAVLPGPIEDVIRELLDRGVSGLPTIAAKTAP